MPRSARTMAETPGPMSPVKDRDDIAPPEEPSVAAALDTLARGPVMRADVALLAGLSGDETALFAQRWPELPEQQRVAIARVMLEVAEERVELLFDAAARVMLDDPSPVVRQLAVAAL